MDDVINISDEGLTSAYVIIMEVLKVKQKKPYETFHILGFLMSVLVIVQIHAPS